MSTCFSSLYFLLLMISAQHQSMGRSDETYGARGLICRRMELTCENGEKIEVQDGFFMTLRFRKACLCEYCPIRYRRYTSGLNLKFEELSIVKERCEDKTNCSVDQRSIRRVRESPSFVINVTYTCQADKENGSVTDTIASTSDYETATDVNILSVNSSSTTDKATCSFSVKDYLAGIGTGVALLAIPVAVFCILFARRRCLNRKILLSPVSREHPSYAGLSTVRLSNIYEHPSYAGLSTVRLSNIYDAVGPGIVT